MTLVGHNPVISYFSRALNEGFLSHAYLLSGPDRIGKRTVALEVIRSAHAGTEPGVNDPYAIIVAPDEKGTISIETDIRPLRKAISLKPPEGTRFFVLIDGAEAMTGPAGQALLKMLEEPPAYVTFLLISPVPGLLPETIRSRCIEIRCAAPVLSDVVAYLTRQGVPEKHREPLAGLAGGSIGWLRDVIEGGTIPAVLKDDEQLRNRLSEGIGQRLCWAGSLAKRDDIRQTVFRWLNGARTDLSRNPSKARALMELYDSLGRSQCQKRLALEHFVLSI